MQIPVVRGIIDRRILINFRVDPVVLQRALPAPFRPQRVNGFGIAGVCLIRLKQIRPRRMPALVGLASENAAHRIAVEWDDGERTYQGVFIPRRDTSSRWNALVGGRLFPGRHHLATFRVREQSGRYTVQVDSSDNRTRLVVDGHAADSMPATSIFHSLDEASRFFQAGFVGYSSTPRLGHFDGLELRSLDWHVRPLAVDRWESSFFSDRTAFPAGSIEFDCALLMRGIEHEWHGRETLCAWTAD